MSKTKDGNSNTNRLVALSILVNKDHHRMLKEIAKLSDSSMNRIIRRLIEKEYSKLASSIIWKEGEN